MVTFLNFNDTHRAVYAINLIGFFLMYQLKNHIKYKTYQQNASGDDAGKSGDKFWL